MQLAENRRLSVGVSVHAPLSVHPERSAAKSKGENKSSLPFDRLRASGRRGVYGYERKLQFGDVSGQAMLAFKFGFGVERCLVGCIVADANAKKSAFAGNLAR